MPDSPHTPPSGLFGLLPGPGAIDRYVDRSSSQKKQVRFTLSGYGVSDAPRGVSFRQRLMAWSYLIEAPSPMTQFNIKTTNNPAQGKGGTCSGDSGGPVFFAGTRVIAAVTSFGMTRCARARTTRTGSTGRPS